MNIHRENNETELQYIWRMCSAKESGELEMNWDELSFILNKELGRNDTSSAYRKPYQSAKLFREQVFASDDYIEELNEAIKRLKIERNKLQTEKIENNKWLRDYARDEMIMEKIVDAIHSLEPINVPSPIRVKNTGARTGVLCFGDAHFGIDFELTGLMGETLNKYNPDIFYNRMEILLQKTEEIIDKEGLTQINVYEMGDFIDGLLRVGQLAKLKYGVIESTIMYVDYLANWLNRLSKKCYIVFQMVGGNHTELRMLGQPKGTFEDENMEKVVRTILKTRLADNPNFLFKENSSGFIFDNLSGYNVLGFHGDIKNLDNAIKDFSNLYGVNIDYLICGHFHHSSSSNVGMDKEIITVPSIMGTDAYAMKIGKTSSAGATFIIFESGGGKAIQYNIKLR